MPSPFPGMDPYLEDPDLWPGFHTTFLTRIRAAITPLLPAGYFAEVEQHVWFRRDDPAEPASWKRPDVYVGAGTGAAPRSRRAARTTAPTVTVARPEVVREVGAGAVRIRDAKNRRVVTAIEVLSPANKTPGTDRDRYLLKRDEYLASDTNLVEIDLLRSGTRVPVGSAPDGDYYVYITAAAEYAAVDVWVFTVRDELPVIPVPLPPHPPLALPLRPPLDQTYDEANYGPQLDYTRPPVPALRPADAAWAAELLAKPKKTRKGGS
jgi:Protein of unknown function (DUF4058)